MKYIIKEENLKKPLWAIFDKIFESLEYRETETWIGFYTTELFKGEEPPQLVVGFNSEGSDEDWYYWGDYFGRYPKIFGLQLPDFAQYLKYYIEEKYNKRIMFIH